MTSALTRRGKEAKTHRGRSRMTTETREVGVMSQVILRTDPNSLPSPLPQPPKAGREGPARGSEGAKLSWGPDFWPLD